MKEILGYNLKQFFDTVDKECKHADITYAGNKYEVWEVSDKLFKDMCDMSEEKFVELAGEDAWWRYSDGSNLSTSDATVYINGYEILGWSRPYASEDEEDEYEIDADSLTDYLCNVMGASQPKNVCALAMDLAKHNDMTMGELFNELEKTEYDKVEE